MAARPPGPPGQHGGRCCPENSSPGARDHAGLRFGASPALRSLSKFIPRETSPSLEVSAIEGQNQDTEHHPGEKGLETRSSQNCSRTAADDSTAQLRPEARSWQDDGPKDVPVLGPEPVHTTPHVAEGLCR